MAQGEFTKQEARLTAEAVKEIFDAVARTRQPAYIGHLNDILLFLTAAERAAPDAPVDSPPKQA